MSLYNQRSVVMATTDDETGENGGFYMTVENGSKPENCKNGLKTQVTLTCDEDKAWTNQDISDYVRVAYHHENEPCMVIAPPIVV